MQIFKKKNEKTINNNSHKSLIVNIARCPQDHSCPAVRVCPVSALSQKGFKAPDIDKEKCIKCGKCVKFCPMKALVFE